MLRALIVLVVIAVALARGGSLRNFADVQLRALPLVFGSFALQLLIFTPFTPGPLIPFATEAIYIFSMALLIIWVWLNRALPGITLVALGVAMNTAAIVANGGFMPVDPLAATYAGNIDKYPTDGPAVANNSVATTENVRLWLFTDIFPLPAAIPLANVYSLGDILLTTGIAIFCYRTLMAAPHRTALAPAGVTPQEAAKPSA